MKLIFAAGERREARVLVLSLVYKQQRGAEFLLRPNTSVLYFQLPPSRNTRSLSGFEILTITFSFIVGLGVAQVLRSIAYMVREFRQIRLHWIPFSVAAQILFFQVQFWFALSVVNSLLAHWSWFVYISMLMLAIFIFLAGASVLPHSLTSLGEHGLKEDFDTRGRISLIFLALYLAGWIVIGIMFWIPELWHLAQVNGSYALIALITFWASNSRTRAALHILLIVIAVYGSFTVWTTPSLEMPWPNPVEIDRTVG